MLSSLDVLLAAAQCKHPQLTARQQNGAWVFRHAASEVRVCSADGESPITIDGQLVAESSMEALELVELRLGLSGPVN